MYNYDLTESGCIVTNSNGDIILMAESEDEAREYMESYSPDPAKFEVSISPYEQFDNYTQKLKGKCWINDKFGSCFETPLNRFAKSFEKQTGYRVIIDAQYIGGEWIFIVDEVE